MLSGFDPVRREVARMALTKLISDGRIHPGRIEETVAKCRAEIEVVMRQAGEQAAYDAGRARPAPGADQAARPAQVPHQLRPERAQPRASRPPAWRGCWRPRSAPTCPSRKKGGLLHDIGKAVDHEVEGPHALIGGDIASRYGVSAGGLQRHRRAPPGGGAGVDRGDRGPDRRRHQRLAARAPAARAWTTTSSGWTTCSRSPSPSRASSAATPSRPAARSASWSGPRTWTTSPARAWRATSSRRSRTSCSTPARSR